MGECAAPSLLADAGKGQKIFIKEMKPACGFDGGVMAKMHTLVEWKAIQDAGKANDELLKRCPEANPLKGQLYRACLRPPPQLRKRIRQRPGLLRILGNAVWETTS